jgi:hypothetical protein
MAGAIGQDIDQGAGLLKPVITAKLMTGMSENQCGFAARKTIVHVPLFYVQRCIQGRRNMP